MPENTILPFTSAIYENILKLYFYVSWNKQYIHQINIVLSRSGVRSKFLEYLRMAVMLMYFHEVGKFFSKLFSGCLAFSWSLPKNIRITFLFPLEILDNLDICLTWIQDFFHVFSSTRWSDCSTDGNTVLTPRRPDPGCGCQLCFHLQLRPDIARRDGGHLCAKLIRNSCGSRLVYEKSRQVNFFVLDLVFKLVRLAGAQFVIITITII